MIATSNSSSDETILDGGRARGIFQERTSLCMARFRVVKPQYLRGVYTDRMFLTALLIALTLI